MEGMKKVKKVVNGSAEPQGEWEGTAWWTGLRQHFQRNFFNLLILLSVEREQLALPTTETAEWGMSRGSKAVQKYNYSFDPKKMGSPGTCKECEAFLGILGSLFFSPPFWIGSLFWIVAFFRMCNTNVKRDLQCVCKEYILYNAHIYTHTHTCYVTCMLGLAKPVRRWEKKIKTCKYFFFSFYKLSFCLGQNVAEQMDGNNCSYLRDWTGIGSDDFCHCSYKCERW